MSAARIVAYGLGKQYRLGAPAERYFTLRDTLASLARLPARMAGRLARGEPLLEPRQLFWALRDVSFEVEQGDVVGIIGRNGAGKTTLLKILSRITEPTEGQARIRGRVASLLEVGTGFHPELTGRENVFLNGAILGMRNREITARFDEIVSFAEVAAFIDTPVKHYSTGMYLRLAFAVAAHLSTDILIIDEVLAVGDLSFQKKCLGKMHDVAGHGRTVLFVSHNISAVTSLCNRTLLLDQGRLVALGPTAEVVAQYLAGSLGTAAERIWPDLETAPGTGGLKLGAVRVLDAEGRPAPVVSVDRPLWIRVEYHVAVPSLRFRIALLLNTQGVCAFPTLEPTEVTRDGPGWYASTVEIPANLLSESDYVVTVSIFNSAGVKTRLARAVDVAAFQVFDPRTGGSARGDYSETLEGVMRPLLRWKLESSAAPGTGRADVHATP